jgi:hypothetical protein
MQVQMQIRGSDKIFAKKKKNKKKSSSKAIWVKEK